MEVLGTFLMGRSPKYRKGVAVPREAPRTPPMVMRGQVSAVRGRFRNRRYSFTHPGLHQGVGTFGSNSYRSYAVEVVHAKLRA